MSPERDALPPRLPFTPMPGPRTALQRAARARELRKWLALGAGSDVLAPERADWPDEWTAEFEERAAIMEFDGCMARRDAEIAAARCLRSQHCDALTARGAPRERLL